MTAYIDSSILLRLVLGQAGALDEWRTIERGVASALIEVECLRTLDRVRLRWRVSDAELAGWRENVFRFLEAIELVDPNRAVLARAAQPLPTELGTVDAIHLATALLWRERQAAELVLATHDAALGVAARASGLRVIGLP